MNQHAVTMVRVYLAEKDGRLESVLAFLRDTAGVRGWTVYRAVAGYGESGKLRSASLVDLSLDLPVTVEFFDEPGKVERILTDLIALVGTGHVVFWPAIAAAGHTDPC